ncbi:hypothetical protein ACP275_10G051700 [Erythranthe tilingii]
MATLCNFPSFPSLSSHKPSFSSHFPSPPNSRFIHYQKCRCTTVFASSFKKSPRASRKVKSDADLRNDINEFLSTVGLPQTHVPTMKELSDNGRQDLANIVRRRGYKFIGQLLTTSSAQNNIGSDIDTGQNEKVKELSVDVLFNDVIQVEDLYNCVETGEELEPNNQSSVSAESNTLSLKEKAAKFVQHGELDAIDDSGFGNTNEFALSTQTINGNVPSPVDPGNSYISSEEQPSNGGDEDLIDERTENQVEVKRLKFLLHQKESELTRLKQQIEREKLALSLLQSKAETEISKAHKLVSEKETELHAAEETLSGLKEVEIEYNGDGDTVELAGSFNGWHNKIKMVLEHSSTIANPTELSRSSRLWRAVLWLYPGVYEMKFVIDGHWRIDPQRESVTRSGVHNNILRVDR